MIIPALNEVREIGRAVASSAAALDCEVIVVDGVSDDETLAVAERHGARVMKAPRGRASQMNAGAASASGDVLLFLHADTVLPRGYERGVFDALDDEAVAAGAFRLAIEHASGSLRLIQAVANWRATRLQMPYGDQALFTRSRTFGEIGGYPDLPLMEDFELVRRLRRKGKIAIVSRPVRTSARRWLELGPWRTTVVNQLIVAAYLAGVSPSRLAGWYRTGRLLPGRGTPPKS